MKTFVLGLFCLLIVSDTAHATLGAGADSIEADRVAFSAARNATTFRTAYRIEELATASGTIREYVSPGGAIFAVAWSGYTHPKLDQLLGSSLDEYRNLLREQPRKLGQRGSRSLAGQGVVVETWGHMRKLQGHAYAPSLLPEGVSASEIR